MTYTDKQIRAFLRSIQLEAWAESTPHIRGVGKLLEALREPSESMRERGSERVGDTRDDCSCEYVAVEAWQAMLDARMGEG